MKVEYKDIIEQTFEFPQEEFSLEGEELLFQGLSLMNIIKEHGTPLKLTYLPKIGEQIRKATKWFQNAMHKADYKANYVYCYCTKSSHFSFVLEEVINNGAHIETSSAFDIDIIQKLHAENTLSKDTYIVCNGYKLPDYLEKINQLVDQGFNNTHVIFDNPEEADHLASYLGNKRCKIGIRIASEEEPKFEFYTSRLGIQYKDIVPFYNRVLKDHPNYELKMLHFFINTGITDTAYYWNELIKSVKVYCQLKKVCPTLDSLNIGGGLPIKNSLSFSYDYEYMIEEIVNQIKKICGEEEVPVPHIFTEFGSFTVGESSALLLKVVNQKKQNDRERWNMIDSSFMTNLPDAWAINKRFVLLAVNNWHDRYERILLGGLTCDSDDYYNSEAHANAIYMPKYRSNKDLYIGFFHTGAYQESIGGYGGVQHCLIPDPKHIIVDKDADGNVDIRVFSEETTAASMMKILGYR